MSDRPRRRRPRRAGTARKPHSGRKPSSTRWLARQHADPYVAAARREGYRSRAAYKLIEIDERFALVRPGAVVVDLGAAPGGWSQVAAALAGAREGPGRVIAVDLSPVEPIPGVEVLELDMRAEGADTAIIDALGGDRADVVLSDMAAPATGHARTDHLRTMALAEAALDLAERVLKPGGTFLAKVLQGGAVQELLQRLKRDFADVRHVKPGASRADSAELYVLARGFRGDAD